jgi:chromosome segregation ATPase
MPDMGAVGEVVERVRALMDDWDRFTGIVEVQSRENDDLRSRCADLDAQYQASRNAQQTLREEHEQLNRVLIELRSEHQNLQAEHDTAQQKLHQLEKEHTAVLRDRQDVYEALESLLHRLKR